MDRVLFTAESLGKQMGRFAAEGLQQTVAIIRGGNRGIFERYYSTR